MGCIETAVARQKWNTVVSVMDDCKTCLLFLSTQ